MHSADADPSFKSLVCLLQKPSDTSILELEKHISTTTSDDELPYSFSIGRRPATDGFLINHRENEKDAGSL